ncbi:hypothetical protein MANES_16G049870v8 [Manihot esculenta]|uniref:Uncharacterized protein n=1 Tax=Manihot esculenta TaxID=3983 RepID=A0ACB7G6C1_MANES|nr:hypothetical protein MANES_16G049870v8 [Manihot esculenta]
MAEVVHVIAGGPDKGKGKNKRVAEDVLAVEQEPWVKQEVRFSSTDKTIEFFQKDSLVIKILLNSYEVRQVLVDIGSSVNLLILNVFNKLGLNKNSLVRVFYPLVGLGDKIMVVLETINLPLVLGDEKYRRELYVEFAVVDIPFAYNVILSLPNLNYHSIILKLGAMCLKLPALGGIVMVRGNPRLAKDSHGHRAKSLGKSTMPIDLLEKSESHIKLKPVDPVEKVQLSKEQKVRFSTALTSETKTHLIELLKGK